MRRAFRTQALAIVLAITGAAAPAPAQTGQLDYIGTYGAWDVRATGPGGDRLCILRAIHDDIGQGDVFWTFAPDRADLFPHGYLAIDPRFLPLGGQVVVVVDDRDGPWPLAQAADGFAYSSAADSPAINEAFRRGLLAQFGISPSREPFDLVEISLLGFTAAAETARRACGMAR
ncbi:MAG: hypothetical protein RLO50_06090 [Azospirillaceae bacterium]